MDKVKFFNVVFHKFYLFCSWILCPIFLIDMGRDAQTFSRIHRFFREYLGISYRLSDFENSLAKIKMVSILSLFILPVSVQDFLNSHIFNRHWNGLIFWYLDEAVSRIET